MDFQKLQHYDAIYEDIKSTITKNSVKPGDKLPSEKTLTETYGVKRATIRKVIGQLMAEGLVFPIRNKGNYVAFPKFTINFQKESSYTKSMLRNKKKPKVKILGIKTVSPTEEQKDLFNMTGDDKLWLIVVLRYNNGIPFLIGKSYIPMKLAPEFNIHYKKIQSIHLVLEDIYGIKPIRKNSQCSSAYSDKEESRILKTFDNSPLFKVTSINVNSDGEVIEHCLSTYRADLVKLNFNIC